MSDAPSRLRAQQFELTRHLRDPATSPAPGGIEDRRLGIYRDLLFNNILGLLSGNFPVIERTLGEQRWERLVRDFYRDHRCHTPLFAEIAREFQRYLQELDEIDPPFLLELAHYEWVELALQLSEASAPRDDTGLADADLLERAPRLSPLAWPLAYAWPVHRLGPDFQPAQPPPAPTLLLLRREADGEVRFSELSPLAFRLLQRLEESPELSAREQLRALAAEAGSDDAAAFLDMGAALLRQMRANAVVYF
ncbi:putative DNA-binding domain-containing protein [Lysobacter sp. K5869]|uniref:HvfC family RiPP maturation protein n=1 Tax=Lysobacter sp. K5869 TaxID=2820808 RepID=UPI001C060E6F|nr:putative DNA-binding domain-containing protein [Lysobacter sp. K5869]QWP74690.1 putative DNA-binding domain-containing protein [Lysobacter sp. K5869]